MRPTAQREGAPPLSETIPEISTSVWKHNHILDLDDFTREEIELIFVITDGMKEILSREIKRAPTLRGKTVVTIFFEPSTRTRASFELAARALTADVLNITASTSSIVKGESLLDTLRTIQALGADVLVMRHSQSGAPYLAARQVNMSVVNAGDGAHAHPSQALLDMYTMRSRLGHLKGRKVVIIGDILHSRVARSNIWGLSAMGAEVVLCGPPTLLPLYMNEDRARGQLPRVTVESNADKAVENADAVMALRLQLERQEKGLLPAVREYVRYYQITQERLARAKPGALVMHPGPVNEGIEVSPEVSHGANSVIEEQVTNGVAVRMALLYLLAGGKKH
ncbi:MAG: pyrB [Dehalococcoidia bacterium]|nr:pyrB [Dehalococcoidia bacterium]